MPELQSPLYEMIAQTYVTMHTPNAVARTLGISVRRVLSALKATRVQARVAEITGDTLEEMGIDPDLIVEALADIAFDPLEQTKDRIKSLELLGKKFAMFVDSVKDTTDRGHDEWVKMLMVHTTAEEADDLSFLK